MKTKEEQKIICPEALRIWMERQGWNHAEMVGHLCELTHELIFARKLKRERDEARMALRELWISADAFLPNFDEDTISRWRKAAGWEGEE
jgi:hypothetical protein